ncbi:putative translation initiation inhibitor, yjgF family [Pseudomonas sp. GM50]|uniref:RidA family protein n=1 Tax=Pseudomonas sp. GM50 TaxID=1144332 RepID=UPI0002707893|nr:RidA family protein [Pseudomonas sp. GM50]EJM67497.1 putative translation initiation inhibitor, yjgF family [Pseudomonas sp. GM50]
MEFQRVFSAAPWESQACYCRALKAGDTILMGGTVAFDDQGKPFKPGDAYAQTLRCLEIIEASIKQLGVDRTRITATRMYTTDMDLWPKIAKAHKEFFEGHPPTTMLLEVGKLILPEYVIEIEIQAYAGKESDND